MRLSLPVYRGPHLLGVPVAEPDIFNVKHMVKCHQDAWTKPLQEKSDQSELMCISLYLKHSGFKCIVKSPVGLLCVLDLITACDSPKRNHLIFLMYYISC